MFNLLVSSAPWAPHTDTMPIGRVLEYTEPQLQVRFSRKEKLDLAALAELPSLFVQETRGDEVARVGRITSAKIDGANVALRYAYDAEVPPIPNRLLEAHAADFGVRNMFEFSRTHWAVKDIDLFQALWGKLLPPRRQPQLFRISEPEAVDKTLVAVMMPFDKRFDAVFSTLRKAAEAENLQCLRADDIWEDATVIQDVVSLIDRAHVVICDCTGRNANVFYEMGIAHALGRNVILLTQSDNDIPFDVRHLRYLTYLQNKEGLRDLTRRLKPKLAAYLSDKK